MKVLSICKLSKSLSNLQVNKAEDEFGNKTLNLSLNGEPIVLKLESCSMTFTKDDNYFTLSPSEDLSDLMNSLRETVLDYLHTNSKEIFEKEFSREKFESGFKPILNPETGSLQVFVKESSSKLLNFLGEPLELNDSAEYSGRLYLNIESLTFVKKEFFLNIYVKCFQETEVESESEHSDSENKVLDLDEAEPVSEEVDTDDSFF
jgi:hypothetical protein